MKKRRIVNSDVLALRVQELEAGIARVLEDHVEPSYDGRDLSNPRERAETYADRLKQAAFALSELLPKRVEVDLDG